MIRPGLLVGLAVLLCAAPAHAQSLREAIGTAYATNPELAEAHARQDALTEAPEQARAAGRPTLSADAAAGYDDLGLGRTGSAAIGVTVPVWSGGRVSSAIRAADAEVAAGVQRVRDLEAAMLERVVTAYAELLFAQQAVDVARIGIERLDRQVDEAQSRFDLGQATRTDVAQLRAQRADVVGNLADAEAALASAAAAYRAVVGAEPGDLESETSPPQGLPADLAAARGSAEAASPLLLERLRIADASAARIGEARAQRMPNLELAGDYGRGTQLSDGRFRGFESAASVGLSLRVPILTGGLVPSRIREAQAVKRADDYAVVAAQRETVRAVDSAWASLEAARLREVASEEGLAAAQLALDGVRAEYEFGLRSTIDILIAEQSFRAAQLALARARSDLLVTQARLLRASGLLDRNAYL